jgi:hypothetical protein
VLRSMNDTGYDCTVRLSSLVQPNYRHDLYYTESLD